jgi:O-antigen ligase
LRPQIGELLLHPFLIPLGLLVPVLLNRALRLPARIVLPGLILVLTVFASGVAGQSFGPGVKIVVSALTVVLVSVSISSEQDFRWAVTGLCAAGTVIAIRGLSAAGTSSALASGLELSVANTVSLYLLPPILLGGLLVIDRNTPKLLRLALAAAAVVMAVNILMSTNRSGALGVVFAGLLLLARGRSVRAAAAVGVLVAGAYFTLDYFEGFKAIDAQIETTVGGDEYKTADKVRPTLIWNSIVLGLENPILGVSPQQLQWELARTPGLIMKFNFVEPHNVVAQLIGGSGLLAGFSFFWLIWSLWTRPPWSLSKTDERDTFRRRAHGCLRMFVLLFLFRGMFASDIHIAPAFCLGLGMTIGLCLAAEVWQPSPNALYSAPGRWAMALDGRPA